MFEVPPWEPRTAHYYTHERGEGSEAYVMRHIVNDSHRNFHKPSGRGWTEITPVLAKSITAELGRMSEPVTTS